MALLVPASPAADAWLALAAAPVLAGSVAGLLRVARAAER
jgi:hypothetical protein